jgi:uncharacterized caspase-like protein
MSDSASRSLDLNPRDPEERLPGRNHLLVIGIDDYDHWSKLNNAVRDAKAFRDLLLDSYGFAEERTLTLFDAEAKKAHIIAALRAYEKQGAQALTAEDNLLIYFAGHGTMNPNKSTGYWIRCA